MENELAVIAIIVGLIVFVVGLFFALSLFPDPTSKKIKGRGNGFTVLHPPTTPRPDPPQGQGRGERNFRQD